jgi:hypothetical protein
MCTNDEKLWKDIQQNVNSGALLSADFIGDFSSYSSILCSFFNLSTMSIYFF